MYGKSRWRANGFALLLLGGLALTTGCATAQPSAAAQPGSGRGLVTLVNVNRTAQVLAAAPGKSSSAHEAVFTLTAYNAQGKPVKNAKVAYFIGLMTPLGNMMPMTWYRSGRSGANAYIESYTKRTNASGQARLTLFGQPSNTMEMIAVQVGNLSSFDAKTKQPVGLLDAWWARPNSAGTAAGDYVVATPFMASGVSATGERVTVTAMSASGPIPHASVQYSVETSGTGGMGMSGNSNQKTMSASQQGRAIFTAIPGAAGDMPVRVVVAQPGGASRVAGGMSIMLSR